MQDVTYSLPSIRGSEINTIVSEYLVSSEPLMLPSDVPSDEPFLIHKFIHAFTLKMLEPSPAYKRTLALHVLNGSDTEDLWPSVADKQTWHDLEIFKEKSVSQTISRAKTEIGKVFFFKQIATPLVDHEALKNQRILLNEISTGNEKTTLLPLLEALASYESVVYGLWAEKDIHYQVLGLVQPTFFSDIPLIGLIPWVKKWDNEWIDNEIFRQVSLTWNEIKNGMGLALNAYGVAMTGFNISGIVLAYQALSRLDSVVATFKERNQSEFFAPFYLEAGLQLRLKFLAGYLSCVDKIQKIIMRSESQQLKKYGELLSTARANKELQELEKLLKTATFNIDDLSVPKSIVWEMFLTFRGRILAASEKLNKCRNHLIPVFAAVGKIDALISVTQLLAEGRFTLAEFDFESDQPYVSLGGYWHPGILGEPVTNSISIGRDKPAHIIVSGPNKGGKSANTEIIPICCLLAQSIGVVPASTFRATPFSTIQVFRNIKDNRMTGDSRFQAEMKRAIALSERAQNQKGKSFSLTYFDELFTGTAPLEGSTAVEAQLQRFGSLSNAISLTTTHYANLERLAKEMPKTFKNFMVKVIRRNGKLHYPYKLEPGFSTDCVAFELAESLGADPAFIGECRNLLREHRALRGVNGFYKLFSRLDPAITGLDINVASKVLNNIFPITRSSLEMVSSDGVHRDLTPEENIGIKGALKNVYASKPRTKNTDVNDMALYILWSLWRNYRVNASNLSTTTMVEILRKVSLSEDAHLKTCATYQYGKFLYESSEQCDSHDDVEANFDKSHKLLTEVAQVGTRNSWESLASQLLLAKMYYESKYPDNNQAMWGLFKHVSCHSHINKTAAGEAYLYRGIRAKKNGENDVALQFFTEALENTYAGKIEGLIRYELGLLAEDTEDKIMHLKKALELLEDESKKDACSRQLQEIPLRYLLMGREAKNSGKFSYAVELFNQALSSSYLSNIEGLIRYELGLLVENDEEKTIHLKKANELLYDDTKKEECTDLLTKINNKRIQPDTAIKTISNTSRSPLRHRRVIQYFNAWHPMWRQLQQLLESMIKRVINWQSWFAQVPILEANSVPVREITTSEPEKLKSE